MGCDVGGGGGGGGYPDVNTFDWGAGGGGGKSGGSSSRVAQESKTGRRNRPAQILSVKKEILRSDRGQLQELVQQVLESENPHEALGLLK